MQVGQLLCGGFEGATVTPQAYHLIVDLHISTMFLSKKNAVSVAQMAKLIQDLQYIAYTRGNYQYPLMFAIDEEGGMVNSLFDPENLTQFPCAMALAATGNTDLVYQVLRALAVELRHIGFLMILGPVLDVVTKLSHQLVGVRSFGTTVESVTRYGMACARGLQDGGLVTMGKHFPGIGNATVDSILELPMVTDSLDAIKRLNCVPFAELIREGVLDGISAAGAGVPTISPDEIHACLSPVVLTQLLRNELHFDGVVISECLEMDALHHSVGLGQGVILAVYAGCDLVMVCHDASLQNEAAESLEKAMANGNLDEDIVLASLARIEKLQKKFPKWAEMFPEGSQSAQEPPTSFREQNPDQWSLHQDLSKQAYRKSITLVRDFADSIPLTSHLQKDDNVLLLTPLLSPIYPLDEHDKNLYPGEEVFQKFGDLLANHSPESSFNVLHTTYTANGLTSLHESLIENSKAVIVVTSEASRNIYQMGIVKYASILCGAKPASFSNSAGSESYSHLSKPLVVIAALSPYDFFYHKNIGSAYLCCYDFTQNVFVELVSILLGEEVAEGCIPGERKFVSRAKKRRLTDEDLPRTKKNTVPQRKWLVDEFELKRDWKGLVTLWKNNGPFLQSDSGSSARTVDYQGLGFFKRLYVLLSSAPKQKHFVVRNSSLNIVYGMVLSWVDESQNVPLDGVVPDESDEAYKKVGHILYILVDKAKRFQSMGRSLHARTMRHLIQEEKCTSVTLGCSFPLLALPGSVADKKVLSFLENESWKVKTAPLKKIMLLTDLGSWLVPKKIFRELMIVGVRFDICSDPDHLLQLVSRSERLAESLHTKSIYLEAIKYAQNQSSFETKIITALEPTHQNIIGSIVLFTNRSEMSKFYPFIDEVFSEETPQSPGKQQVVGAIMCPVIDPSYSNLTEIFRFGLICSGITFLKSMFHENENVDISNCLMLGVGDENSKLGGIEEIGFKEWKVFADSFDTRSIERHGDELR